MRRSASEIIRNLEMRVARLENRIANKIVLDADEKKVAQSLKRQLKKLGPEDVNVIVISTLNYVHYGSFPLNSSRSISDLTKELIGSDGELPFKNPKHLKLIDKAAELLSRRCKSDAKCVAKVFAVVNKNNSALIKALKRQELLD